MTHTTPITIYKTADNKESFITDPGMQKLTGGSMPLPAHWQQSSVWRWDKKYPFEVRMRFGETELLMTAKDLQTGEEHDLTTAAFGRH